VTSPFRSVVVVGAGAVGSFYGAMLARAGHRVTLVGRAAHVQAIERDGLQLDMAGRVETVRLAASVELAAARGADLVLFCVKSTDTADAARALAPHLADDAVVMSLQNGVENAPTLAAAVRALVVPTVVHVVAYARATGEALAARGLVDPDDDSPGEAEAGDDLRDDEAAGR
jgi:2-dehydropantoate 2-reductase